MESLREKLRPVLAFAAEAAAETLWPTRCAVCDAPGKVLCDRCKRALPYLDWWRACRVCGAAYGLVQCCACAPQSLARIGRAELPFAGCASAVSFTGETGQIVRVFKDLGEQRLAVDMGALMNAALPPAWRFDAVTFVPATLAAYRYRGFDHAQLIACEVADRRGVPCASLLERPASRDQRKLGAEQRVANLAGRFRASGTLPSRSRVVLVDDVYTTGATLCSATDALLAAGASAVYCLTFARV